MSLKTVVLALNSLDSSSWTKHEVEDVSKFLKEQFGNMFPDTGRIYHETISVDSDVTPSSEKTIERLQSLDGLFYVIVYPEYTAIPYIVAIVLAVASYLLTPKPRIPQLPVVTQRNEQAPSPNNELSQRTNSARINGRIPDIFGTVRSTPDLLAQPYHVFENNREVEYAYMCIGRGYYNVSKIRDGETLLTNIGGSSAAIYAPYTSPNSGDDPQLLIGNKINARVLNTKRSNSVNGQVLRPPNNARIEGNKNIVFEYPNVIRYSTFGGNIPFGSMFFEGDQLTIENAVQTGVSGAVAWDWVDIYTLSGGFGGNPFDTDFDNGGFISFYVGGANASPPAGWIVGAQVTIVQQTYKDTGDYAVYGPGYVLVTGAIANLSGVFTISKIVSHQAGGPMTLFGILLDDPGSVNSNWNHAFGTFGGNVLPLGNDGTPLTAFDSISVDADIPGFDLGGVYDILAVTNDTIVLDSPADVNADWNILDGNSPSTQMSPILSTGGNRWIGPFILEDANCDSIIANFVAVNGLYKDNGTDQTAISMWIGVEVTPVDDDDVPTGTVNSFQVFMQGSDTLKESVGVTLKGTFTTFSHGRCMVRASRFTETDTEFEGQVVDEVRWRDLYSVSPVTQAQFGNVTTVHSVTYATASALAVKERQLNMIVQRKLPVRIDDTSTFDDVNLVGTNRADAIFCAICRDRYIGNRKLSEIDVAQIYETVQAVEDYFGHTNLTEFCYTFDNDNISFQETADSVAQAIFSVAYRRANVIKLSFEKKTDDSIVLFNHRNKMPNTEQRNVAFGNLENNDGLQYSYVNPDDDSIITTFLPNDFPSTNPKKVESVGVRNHLQAYMQTWRIFNKMQFQRMTTQFDALQEAQLVIRGDRILVSDSTTSGTQDGEIVAVDGLELTLSQQVDLATYTSYSINLQHVDGTVENIAITAGSASNKVVLSAAPAHDLNVDPETSSRCAYLIVGDSEQQVSAFLVAEREPASGLSSTLIAINYDERFYTGAEGGGGDFDYINNVIDIHGYGPLGGYHAGDSSDQIYNGGGGLPPPPVGIGIYSLDATGGIPDVPANAAYNFGTGDFSVEAWVYYDEIGTFGRAQVLGQLDVPYWEVNLTNDGADNYFGMLVNTTEDGANNITLTDPGLIIPAQTWTHLAVTINRAGNISFYVNGALIASQSLAFYAGHAFANNTNGLFFSISSTSDHPLAVADVRLWSDVRTGTEIADNYNAVLTGSEANLVGYWKLNEGSGTVLGDSSPTGNDGTLLADKGWAPNFG